MAGPVSRARRGLALALALVAPLARADEMAESPDDPSAFSTVLEARDYDERFATVEDLLERAPGVRVRRFGGLGAHSTASIRGSKAEQVLVLVDGVRVASTERGAFDFSTLPLREIERVEILRGGGSARFGSDALGGVISITTRRPEGPDPGADLSLTAGTHDTFGGDVSLAGGGEQLRTLGSYTRLHSDNDFGFEFGGSSHERLNASFLEQGGLLRSELDLGRGSQLDSLLWLHDRDGGQPGSVQGKPQTDIADDVLSCATADEQGTRGLARLGWRGELGRDGGLEVAGFHRREGSWLDDPAQCLSVGVLTDRTHTSSRENSTGLDVLANAPDLELGAVWLSLRGSASVRHDGVTADDTQAQRRTSGAFSLLGDAEFFERRLRILPALGFDAARSSDGLARSAAFRGFQPVSLRDESVWLPGIGAIAELAPGLRAKANWKRAFRRPSFAELFHPDDSYIRGNPDLRSERATNADAGLELSAERLGPVRDLFVQVAAFRRDIDESIEWMFNTGNVYMPLNTGAARVDGVELSGSLRLLEHLDLELGHTWSNARLVDQPPCTSAFCSPVDAVFPHVPRRAGFARAELALGDARLHGELRWESEIGFQVGQQVTAPAALQLDAGLSLHPQMLPGLHGLPRGLSLSLDAVNLGREQRIDSLGQPLPRDTLVYLRVRAVTP